MIQWMLRNISRSLAIVLIGFCGQIALADEGVPAKVVSVSTDHTAVLQASLWLLSVRIDQEAISAPRRPNHRLTAGILAVDVPSAERDRGVRCVREGLTL